jgi:peptidoglycan/xylan/chitin deacetylase (PgdA/CDA1 family)
MTRFLSRHRRDQIANAGKWGGGLTAAALHTAFGDRSRGRFGILLYHRVVPFERSADPPSDSVTPGRFRRQLEGLLQRAYRFAPLSDVVADAARGQAPPRRTVVVTFDDGYDNVREYALPVLRDLDIPASVFVTTAYIGSNEPFPFDPWADRNRGSAPPATWRPLDWEGCTVLAASGLVEVGSHTHTHRDLRADPDAFEQDVRTSLEVLGSRLGAGPRPFAFPYGNVSSGFAGTELVAAARRAGVTCGLTTEIELVDPTRDPFSWGRVEAVESDSPATCAAKLAGWYGWMGYTRRAFQRVASR